MPTCCAADAVVVVPADVVPPSVPVDEPVPPGRKPGPKAAGAEADWAGDAWPTTVVVAVAACTPNTAAAAMPSDPIAPAATTPVRRRFGSGVGVISVSVTVSAKAPSDEACWDVPRSLL